MTSPSEASVDATTATTSSRARDGALENLTSLQAAGTDLASVYGDLEIAAVVAAGFDALTDRAAALRAQDVYAVAFLARLHQLDTSLAARLSHSSSPERRYAHLHRRPFDLFRELTVAGLWCRSRTSRDAADSATTRCHQSAAAYDRTGRSLLAGQGPAATRRPSTLPRPTGLAAPSKGA